MGSSFNGCSGTFICGCCLTFGSAGTGVGLGIIVLLTEYGVGDCTEILVLSFMSSKFWELTKYRINIRIRGTAMRSNIAVTPKGVKRR
jgi:hypothetical protein